MLSDVIRFVQSQIVPHHYDMLLKDTFKRSSKPLHLCDFEIYVGNQVCNVNVYTLAHTRGKSTSFVF